MEIEHLKARLLSIKPEKLSELKAKLGPDLFKKTFFGKSEEDESDKPVFKRKSNKAPREMSSKKPITRFRKVVEIEKPKNFDPRFRSECGDDFDEIKFQKNFGFLDDLRKNEILDLKKAYRAVLKEGNQQRAERIRKNYMRLENQLNSSKTSRLRHEMNAEIRLENIERMNRGERPIYYNNQELKNKFLLKKSQQKQK